MSSTTHPYLPGLPNNLDLDVCGLEPIRYPGTIQPHGHLLAFEGPHLLLSHASAAATGDVLSADVATLLGQPFKQVLQPGMAEVLLDGMQRLPERGLLQLGTCQSSVTGTVFQAIAHRAPDGLAIVEFEAVPVAGEAFSVPATLEGLYPQIRDAFDRLGSAATSQDIAFVAATELRRITGFDRVLVYRFEANWDGVVIAEERNDRLPSYLDLRFPASDIPHQARQLYTTNRLRLIVDADYTPVAILPANHPRTGEPLDLSFAALRSVSPMHLEYMRNMGTAASMSISLLQGGKLWGLISCHHAQPRRVPFAVRAACDLIGQMLAIRIAAKEDTAHAEERVRLRGVEGRLLAQVAAAKGSLADGLTAASKDLCELPGATGAAILTQDHCTLIGQTPLKAEVQRIAEWLRGHRGEDAFSTHTLGEILPGAAAFADTASGLLAISISRLHPHFVLWFRPEIVRTVSWGGDPRKPVLIKDAGSAAERIGPRRSFDAWKQTVRGTSVPWTAAQVEAVHNLRSAIVGIVLGQAEERAALTNRLQRTNAELEAFSYSVSHDLRAPFRHIVGFAELLLERDGAKLDDKARRYIVTIIDSAQTAGLLVDALLNFSRMGRTSLTPIDIDAGLLVREVVKALALDLQDRNVEWHIDALPVVRADPVMLRQVFQNLLSNAVKYTRREPKAVIEVWCETQETEFTFGVRDNGVGFDMAYAHKLFGVFQRLHRAEDYEGVGVGLANVRRVVERHGGRTWADGKLNQHATFYFTLPRIWRLQEKA